MMRFRDLSFQVLKSSQLRWYIGLILVFLAMGYSDLGWASGGKLDEFAKNITNTFQAMKNVMTAAAYVAGVSFAIIGLLKFKAHKDNPAQIPLSTPIALIAVSAGLLFLPTVFEIAGSAVFGESAAPDPFGGGIAISK